MTGAEFKAIRTKLDCTAETFARAIGWGGKTATVKSNMFHLERGDRPIPDDIGRLAVMLGRHGIPDAPWFTGTTLARLTAMFRHYGVPAERSFENGDVHAGR